MTLTLNAALHHQLSLLPSANIWPVTLWMTFPPNSRSLSPVVRSGLNLFSGERGERGRQRTLTTLLHFWLLRLSSAYFLASNLSNLITAECCCDMTGEDRRRCQAVQVWVLARVGTAVDMDFDRDWRNTGLWFQMKTQTSFQHNTNTVCFDCVVITQHYTNTRLKRKTYICAKVAF